MKKIGQLFFYFSVLLMSFSGTAEEAWANHTKRLSVGIKRLNINGVTGSGTVQLTPPNVICSKTTSKNCKQKYPTGTIVSLAAAPDPGSAFVKWIRGCSGTSAMTSVTLTKNISCKAVFRPLPPCILDAPASKLDHCRLG